MHYLFLAPVAMLLVTGTFAQSRTSAVERDKFLPESVKDLKALQTRVRAVVDRVTPATVGVGTRWRAESYAMAWPQRPRGEVVGLIWVQFLPSNSQVSASKAVLPVPPKSTTRWRAESYAIAWPTRAGGEVVGLIWVQFLPSHSQVSAGLGLERSYPPKSTVRLRAESYAIACPRRNPEGDVVGLICVQFLPSHSQVSPRPLPLPPPKSTTRRRAASYAIACPWRAGGEVVGLICVQFLPSHSQVSASATARVPEAFKPPKSTVR